MVATYLVLAWLSARFAVADDFGWLVVPNGILYAAIYVQRDTPRR